MLARVSVAVAKAALVSLAFEVLQFFAPSLAFFGFVPILGALLLAFLLTADDRQYFRENGHSGTEAIVIVSWLATLLAMQLLLFDQRRQETLPMVVRESGLESLLEFSDHSGITIGVISRELPAILSQRRQSRVDVVFEITRDIGCVRSFRVIRIADLLDEPEVSRVEYAPMAEEPWPNPHWCALKSRRW
jgi:hypothetical protein